MLFLILRAFRIFGVVKKEAEEGQSQNLKERIQSFLESLIPETFYNVKGSFAPLLSPTTLTIVSLIMLIVTWIIFGSSWWTISKNPSVDSRIQADTYLTKQGYTCTISRDYTFSDNVGERIDISDINTGCIDPNAAEGGLGVDNGCKVYNYLADFAGTFYSAHEKCQVAFNNAIDEICTRPGPSMSGQLPYEVSIPSEKQNGKFKIGWNLERNSNPAPQWSSVCKPLLSKAPYCRPFANLPPYQCTKEIPYSAIEKVGLASGNAEFFFALALTFVTAGCYILRFKGIGTVIPKEIAVETEIAPTSEAPATEPAKTS